MSVLPNNTFISPGNPFYGNGGSGNITLPSTINASTINAPLGNISTVNTSTVNVIQINIDNQILTADANDLLLNGIPIATISQLSNIADWSLYEAISTVRMNNKDLSNVNNVYFQNGLGNPSLQLQANTAGSVLSVNGQPLTAGNAGNTANWSQYPAGQDVNVAQYNLNNVKNISSTGIVGGAQFNINNTGGAARLTTDVTGTNLLVNGAVVATGGAASNWSQFPANTNVDMAYNALLNTKSINLVSSIGATGNGTLTVNDTGTQLFYNNQLVQVGSGEPVSSWYLYPALSSVQVVAGEKIYSLGELNVVGGSLNLETSAQLNNSTNSVLISDTGVRITGDDGIYLGANGGCQIGGLGGVSISAVGGVAVSAGALFTVNVAGIISLIAGGILNLSAVGLASLAATGIVNIGSEVYTSIEKIRINDNVISRDGTTASRIMMYDVQKINGNQTDGLSDGFLHIEGDEVSLAISSTRGIHLYAENGLAKSNPLALRADGTTGTGLDETFYWIEQVFNPSSLVMDFTIGTDNITNTHAPLLIKYNSKVFDVLTGSTITNSINQNYDGYNTITYSGSNGVNISNVSNFQAGTINANVINTNILNLNDLNLQNASISSLNVSSINANSIIASTIGTPYFLVDSNSVALGFGTLASVVGNNNVSIGNNAGLLNQGLNTVAVGFNAGRTNQLEGAVAIGGLAANAGQNEYSIALGFRAANSGLRSNSIYIGGLPIGQNETFIENNTIILNASGTPLIGTNPGAFYVRSLRQPPDKVGYYTVGYNPSNNEVAYTTTLGLNELSTTVANTRQITYDEGLLNTTVDGLFTVNGDTIVQEDLTVSGTITGLSLTNLSSLTLNGIPNTSATNTLLYNSTTKNVSYFPITNIVASPQFVYYVSKNGRTGASGSITDPLSSINEALTKPANTGAVDPPGMVIYVAVGAYTEDVVIPISATLPSVSIIGMSNDTDDSKQVQIRGSISISCFDVFFVNTVNNVVINNIAVFAKNTGLTTAVAMTGRGYRVYLQNGLYTSPVAMSVPLISLAGTNGLASNATVQLVINNCSISSPTGSTGHIVSVSGGSLFEIKDSDLTQRGTAALAVSVTGGTFSAANNSNFEGAGACISLAFTAAGLANFTNCLIRGSASPTVAILTLGANANLNLSNNTIQNLNTVEANNTSRYLYVTSAGLLIASIRNNFSSSATTPITQMTAYQSTTPSLALFYFANIYSNAQNSIEENLPVWASVRQFGNDLLIPQFQVTATSATPIALNASVRGRTYILTGTTTQPFTTTGLTATDAGFCVIVHNGNGTGGGDINISGATGTTIVHNRNLTQNGQNLYLFWNGLTLVGY